MSNFRNYVTVTELLPIPDDGADYSTYKSLIHSLKIADSTKFPHANDSRAVDSPDRRAGRNGGTGMGTGEIRVLSGMRMSWSQNDNNVKPMFALRPMA